MKILRRLREQCGLTLRQVEEATNISNAYLSQLETGKIKRPSAQSLYILSKLYGYTVEKLLIEGGIIEDIDIVPIEFKGQIEERLTDIEKRLKRLEGFNSMNIPML